MTRFIDIGFALGVCLIAYALWLVAPWVSILFCGLALCAACAMVARHGAVEKMRAEVKG